MTPQLRAAAERAARKPVTTPCVSVTARTPAARATCLTKWLLPVQRLLRPGRGPKWCPSALAWAAAFSCVAGRYARFLASSDV